MLSTSDVGRRTCSMSGRSSQDTVVSHGESTTDASDENRIIQSPPAPRRRRIRCLVPMLLAMFVVFVGVVATPVAVFVVDGNGHLQLPFFKKNETTVAELSLAAITRASTEKSLGRPGTTSPMDAPQQEIVALTTPRRPKASRETAGGPPIGSRYHGVTRRKDSNRERVYAPTVFGISKTSTRGNLGEVQRLTEEVMVVPKGGVMSKLRAKEEDDEATAAPKRQRRSNSPRGKESKSGHKVEALVAVAAGTAVSATGTPGHHKGDATRPILHIGATGVTANDNTATQHDPFSASFGDTANGDLQSHSLNRRHNRRIGGKLVNPRRRRKRKLSTKPTTHSGTGSSSNVGEKSYATSLGSAALGDVSVRHDHASMSIEVHRKGSNRKAKDPTRPTMRVHRRKKPRMRTSAEEKTTTVHSSKLQDFMMTSVSRDGSLNETRRETTNSKLASGCTIGSNVKTTKSNLILGEDSPVTPTQTKESSMSSRKRNVAPRNAIDSVPYYESQNNTTQTGIPASRNALNERKQLPHTQSVVEVETREFHEFTKQPPIINTTQLYAAKSVTPQLLDRKSSERASKQVPTNVSPRPKLADDTTQANLPNIGANHSILPEEDGFVDFNINLNNTIEDISIESRNKHSDEDGGAGGGLITQISLPVNEVSELAVMNFKQNGTSKTSVPVSTLKRFAPSGTGYTNGFPSRKQNLGHENARLISRGIAVDGYTVNGNSAMTTSQQIEKNIDAANSPVPKARDEETPTSRETLDKKGKRGVRLETRTSMKPERNQSDADSGSLIEMEVNFLSRINRTNRVSVPTTGAGSGPTSPHVSLKTAGVVERGTVSKNQASVRLLTSSVASKPPAGAAEWFRYGGMPLNSTTQKPLTAVILSSNAVPNTQASEGASSRVLTDDDDDDEDNDEEEHTSSQSQGRAERHPTDPSIVVKIREGSAKLSRRSNITRATFTSTEKRIAEKFSEKAKTTVLEGSSASTSRKNAMGVLRLSGMLKFDEVPTTDSPFTVQIDLPAAHVNNPETTKRESPTPLNSTERSTEQSKGKPALVTAAGSHPDTTTPLQQHAMPESAVSANASLSQRDMKRNSSLNNSDEGSVWRTIVPPKSFAANKTTVVAGLGVENYYDDGKNDTLAGDADASEGRSKPMLENRRIAGEIGVTTRKLDGKPDVFQTEYYYDDAPPSKAGQSTPADITESGYENAPEQEAIDDLFF